MMYAYSVSTKRSLVVALVALVVVMSGQRAQAQPGTVLSHQKISDTEGGFKGILVDTDWFGASTMVALGDLGGQIAASTLLEMSNDDSSALVRTAAAESHEDCAL